jgi:23S rRNA (cytosine1962-C5)-methyltransferase
VIPCLLFEDEHLLVIDKPAGMNTHAPGPFAGEGIYDWLRHREPRWAALAIIHRLDKETSGVMVFGKTAEANRSLTQQFTDRAVRKKYLFLTDRRPRQAEVIAKSRIARAGDHYGSNPRGEAAETRFRVASHEAQIPSPTRLQKSGVRGPLTLVEAEPLTGRTHQVRVHAAENGFPVLGDTLYGGAPFARVCLHALEIQFRHPVTEQELRFEAPVDFFADPAAALRAALIDPLETDAYRLVHGAGDKHPGWYLDRFGGFYLSQSAQPPSPEQKKRVKQLAASQSTNEIGIYHKLLKPVLRGLAPAEACPRLIDGKAALHPFAIRENAVQFEVSFDEGYSVGLFLDQRDNRRRLLTRHVASGFPLFQSAATPAEKPGVLNLFAYTCGFSVCAAMAGARTTSVDLSRKYLDWGKRIFALNGLDPAGHDFIYGEAFDWLARMAKKARLFDVVLLDPPTFSQSRERGPFRVRKDYPELVGAALAVLKEGGVLFAASNLAGWAPQDFVAEIELAVRKSKRKILDRQYAPQPPDFPIARAEPAYLKTIWLRIGKREKP